MNLIKKTICLFVILCLIVCGVACAGGDNPSNPSDGGGGSGGNAQTAKISSSLLDGKVANFLEAEGIGIEEKKEAQTQTSNASPYRAVYADEETTVSQKKTELVKDTEDGVYDVCFHEIDGEEKSYKDLNKKFDTHHHDGVECNEEDCDRISDELKAEEQSGAVDTVLSLDARVNKMYTVGNFTFMCVSSAVKGEVHVLTETSKFVDAFGPLSVYGTKVNVELVSEEFSFSCISVGGGLIPIKMREDEKEYQTSNYWSDDYNQSYIIDNETGVTYSLSQFRYIYSVEGGILKIYNEQSIGNFDYYKPVINENGVSFEKYEFNADVTSDANTVDAISSSNAVSDIYGNIVFDSGRLSSSDKIDEDGEMKIDSNQILAQKVRSVYDNLYSTNRRNGGQEYGMAIRYQKGSDGRIYRINFKGDMTNVSINVLDENCVWQSVENDVDVEFYFGVRTGFIAYGVGNRHPEPAFYRLTCIKNGYAYYSTAACSGGAKVYARAYYDSNGNIDSEGHFVGVVKVRTDGTGTDANDFIQEVMAYCGKPQSNPYSVILVGNTQMIYFAQDGIYLWNVATGEYKNIRGTFSRYYCAGGEVHNNLYVEGLGYLNIESEVDFDSFGAASFSETPVYSEVQYDAYYKLLTAK